MEFTDKNEPIKQCSRCGQWTHRIGGYSTVCNECKQKSFFDNIDTIRSHA